jgi:hypothetical protein
MFIAVHNDACVNGGVCAFDKWGNSGPPDEEVTVPTPLHETDDARFSWWDDDCGGVMVVV